MHLLERLPREAGRDFALRVLKENIINLDLEPGAQISEKELADELGLSRTPVREALLELAKVKMIEIRPQKKSVVAPIDYDLVEESRFLRNLLECAIVEIDCEMATEDDLARLRENVRLQNFYLESNNLSQIMALDNQFHEYLFDIAHKSQIFTLTQDIAIHFDRVRTMALSSVKDLKIVQDHESILHAIEAKDAALARSLMVIHLNRYKIDAAAIKEKYPQYFS